MDEITRSPTIKELEKKREKHGELIYCSWSSRSSGMMFGSDSYTDITLKKENGTVTFTNKSKPPFGALTSMVYSVGGEVFLPLKELIEKENIAAWTELRYVGRQDITDVTFGESVSFVFDDRTVGGLPYVHRGVNVQAVRQQGRGDTIDRLRELLISSADGGTLISEETGSVPTPGMFSPDGGAGFMHGSMNMLSDPDNMLPPGVFEEPDGKWVCSNCGRAGNDSRFCPDCGSPREKI